MNDDKMVELYLKNRASKQGLGEKNEPTGCYCVPAKKWCEKFTSFHNDFWRECCQRCHVKRETDAKAEARFKKWKEEKEEQEKLPKLKRDWTRTEPDGNIGAKAYE